MTEIYWDQVQTVMIQYSETMHCDLDVVADVNAEIKQSQARKRKSLYKLFVYEIYGHLGRGNRIHIPHCVRDEIRTLFPDPEDEYMGHMSE